MKILIAIPTYESILPDTYKSIWDMDKCGNECLFEFVRGYDVATARNNIALKAIELGVDYVLMVDNDVVLPKDTLVHFAEDIKPVQLGVYSHRPKEETEDFLSIIFGNDRNDWKHQYTIDEINSLHEPKVLVRGGGLGCALIKTDVFNEIRYPYFVWVAFFSDPKKHLSEDLYFCEQCIGKHIPIYIDTRVKCGHVIRFVKNI